MPTKKEKLYNKLKQSPTNIRFDEICRIAEIFGFIKKGGKGSHAVFELPGYPVILNFQEKKGGKAKKYQVKQLILIIERFKLIESEGGL